MDIDGIFAKIASHMIKGMMIHNELTNYYAFLGLDGYRKFQRRRFIEESKSFLDLNEFYIKATGKLIPNVKIDIPSVIPQNVYRYNREDISGNDIRNAVKTTTKMWVDWEKETKQLYEDCYMSLINDNGAVFVASKVKELINDVGAELEEAVSFWMSKKASDFSIEVILQEQ